MSMLFYSSKIKSFNITLLENPRQESLFRLFPVVYGQPGIRTTRRKAPWDDGRVMCDDISSVHSSPTFFYGEGVIDFRKSRLGQAMILTDPFFGDNFSNSGRI